MTARIEQAPLQEQIRFGVAGDSGAWPDRTADGIYAQLLDGVAALDPSPLFFANLGDVAGPGTPERHERYLRLVERLPVPSLCVVGNHDLDDPGSPEAFARFHGPMNFDFGHGHTRFVVLHAQPGVVGRGRGGRDGGAAGRAARGRPRVPRRTPPRGRGAAPRRPDAHAPASRRPRRAARRVGLRAARGGVPRPAARARRLARLLCARARLRHDRARRRPLRLSGGGGTGLCSHFRGICTEGEGTPEARGALFHAVELAIDETGGVSGRVAAGVRRRAGPVF